MANEIQLSFRPSATVYAMVFNSVGQVYNTSTMLFENYNTSNVILYGVSMNPIGSASSFYEGSFPAAIGPGIYNLAGKQQLGANPAESDPTVGTEDDFNWNGTYRIPLSDLATSGQLSFFTPVRIARSTMVQNFPLYFKSNTDHVTPLVSGVVSGQISRDGSNIFGPLQSGAFTETGLGFYTLQALTSGDLQANTVQLLFTAVGVSGGVSDPLPIALTLQPS